MLVSLVKDNVVIRSMDQAVCWRMRTFLVMDESISTTMSVTLKPVPRLGGGFGKRNLNHCSM